MEISLTAPAAAVTAYIYENIKLYNQDCLEGLKNMPSDYLDVICIDPPYLYLVGQRLERPFDAELFFYHCRRVLKSDGFIIMFGRGTTFYRWNTLLADNYDFKFLEEFIWDKAQGSSPLMPITRVHETVSLHRKNPFDNFEDFAAFYESLEKLKQNLTISVHTKGKGKIVKNKVPYLEMKAGQFDSIIQDIKRLLGITRNNKSLQAVMNYLQNNNVDYSEDRNIKTDVTLSKNTKNNDRCEAIINSMTAGMKEKSIIRTDLTENDAFTKHGITAKKGLNGDRACNVLNSICEGMNEKTIIKQVRDHYTAVHPTQKPVRLIERLLTTVLNPYKEGSGKPRPKVADFFAGSFSAGKACYNLGFDFQGWEIDKIYFDDGVNDFKKFIGNE